MKVTQEGKVAAYENGQVTIDLENDEICYGVGDTVTVKLDR